MENFGRLEPQRLQDYFKDPRKLMDLMNKNKKNLLYWIAFSVAVYAIFAFFSSGDFSFVLTLGSLVQMFGFSLIALRTFSSKSVTGLSKNSIICYTICLFSRLVSIMLFDGYLPFDKSGDYVYRFAELVSFSCCVFVLYQMEVKCKNSYNWDLDNIKWFYVVIPTSIFGILFHPSLNNNIIGDIPWTIALYLEAFSMFPQIDMFRKKGGEIETFTGTYVASSGISKFLHFTFWIFTYSELNEVSGTSLAPTLVGYFVLLFQVIQLALIIEYLYFYFKSLNSGIPILLPQSYLV